MGSITLLLQRKKPRHREVPWPAQGHTTRMWPGCAGLRLCTAPTFSASQLCKAAISQANKTCVYFASPAVESLSVLSVPAGTELCSLCLSNLKYCYDPLVTLEEICPGRSPGSNCLWIRMPPEQNHNKNPDPDSSMNEVYLKQQFSNLSGIRITWRTVNHNSPGPTPTGSES